MCVMCIYICVYRLHTLPNRRTPTPCHAQISYIALSFPDLCFRNARMPLNSQTMNQRHPQTRIEKRVVYGLDLLGRVESDTKTSNTTCLFLRVRRLFDQSKLSSMHSPIAHSTCKQPCHRKYKCKHWFYNRIEHWSDTSSKRRTRPIVNPQHRLLAIGTKEFPADHLLLARSDNC